jgi:hypothetical protein
MCSLPTLYLNPTGTLLLNFKGRWQSFEMGITTIQVFKTIGKTGFDIPKKSADFEYSEIYCATGTILYDTVRDILQHHLAANHDRVGLHCLLLRRL